MSSLSCPVRLAFQDGEPESLFEETSLLETMKKVLPRFGQPDDLQAWMNGEDPAGYATGFMATSIIVTSVLVLWGLLLCLCARAGPKRVGWLSGKTLVKEPPLLLPPSTLQQETEADALVNTFQSSDPHDYSGQSSSTAKHANNATNGAVNRLEISPTESLLDASCNDAPLDEYPGTSLLSSIMDSTLPSMSTLQSMFIDEEDEEEEEEVREDDNKSEATPPRDLDPPLPTSPFLPPRLSSSATARQVQVEVEVSALTTPDPEPPLSSSNSVASTTSEKYADYLKYLDEAMNRPKLITSPEGEDDDGESIDSDDMLLEDILADDEPTFWSSDLPPPPKTVVPDESIQPIMEPPSILRSRPDALNLFFPDTGENSFLFEENATSKVTEPPSTLLQQQQSEVLLPPSAHPAPLVEPDTPTSLPRSKFSSQAASRKRLLESYVENRKRSSTSSPTPISPLLVSDDSALLTDVEHGLLVRPEPMAKVYDDDDDDDTDNNEDHSDDMANSSKDESISDLVDDLLAHALAPSLDENESPNHTPRGDAVGAGGVDLDETQSTMESHLLPPSWKHHSMDHATTDPTSSSETQQHQREVIQREKRETNSTQPTDQSTTSTRSHDDDEGSLNRSKHESYTQAEQTKIQDEYAKSHELWLEERRRAFLRLNRLRIGVVFVATFLVMATLLGALNGAWALDWNRRAVLNGWSNIQSTAMELQNNVAELRTLQSSIRPQLWNLWQLFDQHCPLVRTSICPLAYQPTSQNVTCNLTGIPMEDAWQRWLGSFTDDDTVQQTLFEPEDWDAFAVDLSTLADQPIEHSLDGWNWALWASVACNCLLSIFALSVLAAISLDGATRLHYQLSTWAFTTVYWITVLLAWIFGIGFIIGTILAVDSCTATVNDMATPAITAKALLAKIPTKSFLPQYWDYIVEGCPSESYPDYMSERVWAWGNTLPVTVRIASRLQAFADKDFLDTCGSPITPLRSAAEAFSGQLCMVTQSLVQVRRNLGCDQWYPWYESMADDAICYQGSSAFVWSSACQIAVLVMAFLLWTMRVSFLSLANNNTKQTITSTTNKTINEKNDSNNDQTTPAELEPSTVEDEGE